MQRFSKPLKEHVAIVYKHADYLVKRLSYRSSQIGYRLEKYRKNGWKDGDVLPDEIMSIYKKMKDIQEELSCIEEYVKKKYPDIAELYDALKIAELKDAHD